MIPANIRLFDLFIEGKGHAGVITSLTPPKLVKKMEEYRAGGMNTPIDMDLGTEKLEMSFELAGYEINVLRLFGCANHAGVKLRLKGSTQRDDFNVEKLPVEYILRGRWQEVDTGDWKAGEATTLSVTVSLSYMEHIVNGETITKIDVENCIEMVNGVDLMAEHNRNIGR